MRISQETVLKSINHLRGKKGDKCLTQNKFWGLLCIMRSINTHNISPNTDYWVSTAEIGTLLNELFYFSESDEVTSGSEWCIRFACEWDQYAADNFLNSKPNVNAVAVFAFKYREFSDVDNINLVSLFLSEYNINLETAKLWFSFDDFDVKFDNVGVNLNKLRSLIGMSGQNYTLSFENSGGIVSKPSELSRAPFIQTLYAGKDSIKCMLLSESDLAELYPMGQTKQTPILSTDSLQVIYYGAPGTGKSHQTDLIVSDDKDNLYHQRTTFHPDTDYSSFVGCYKPTKEGNDLTYKFIPQVFLKAYTDAWKNLDTPYFLIIEEINRGNCAQIFGDIFQLLDRREDGFSKYHITTDTDIQSYLANEAFKDVSIDESKAAGINVDQILNGKIMQLPNNLHIFATMNTSDQSLFPIDSAFKRRWDWEYKPIEQPTNPLYQGWKIVTSDNASYDWWLFLQAINKKIFDATHSEDKKMGYWFTKADKQKRISQKTFIGKVLFYLWNDVFKDYALTEETAFKGVVNAETKEEEEYKFTDFFLSTGVTERIHRLMLRLEVPRENWLESEDQDADEPSDKNSEKYVAWKDGHKSYWGQLKPLLENTTIPNVEDISKYPAYYLMPVFGVQGLTLAFYHYTHKGRNQVCVGIRLERNNNESEWNKIAELKYKLSSTIGLEAETWTEKNNYSMVVRLKPVDFKSQESTEQSLLWLAEKGVEMYQFFSANLPNLNI